jgi:alpha-N-arabinofuranosidase
MLRAQAPATLTVELKQAKAPVSPTLHGLMTEEINYSYDGAELIRNRTFRSDWTGVLNWFVVENGAAIGKLSADDGTGLRLRSPRARSSKSPRRTRATAGLLNEGDWGIAVPVASCSSGECGAPRIGAAGGSELAASLSVHR